MKQVDFYHVKDPVTNKFTCYNLYQTIHRIAKMATDGEFNVERSSANIENLNKMRGINTTKEDSSFLWMHEEKQGEVSPELFFQVYGVSVERA